MESFSLAICTHNRAGSLEQALASLAMAAPPANFGWEVLVILNDCSDRSAELVQGFAGRLPIRAVVEPRLGLSHARNRAVEACRGDVIVFIDDDVCVDPAFLQAYENAFGKWPEADIFSGPIVPLFEGRPPPWLERSLPAVSSAFGLQTADRDGAPIDAAAPPYGCNYAIRLAAQKRRPYHPDLGRGGVGWLRGGEETEVLGALLAAGSTGRWVAAASVRHVIGRERQTLAYLRRYYEGYGILVGVTERRRRSRRFPTISAAGEMVFADLAYRAMRVAAPPERWAPALIRAAVRRGKWKSRFL